MTDGMRADGERVTPELVRGMLTDARDRYIGSPDIADQFRADVIDRYLAEMDAALAVVAALQWPDA